MKNIKEKIVLFLLSALLMSNINIIDSRAESIKDQGYVEANEIILNNKKLELDIRPLLKNGRTLVAGKNLFEVLGFDFELDRANKIAIAKKDDINIKLALDKSMEALYFNDIKIDLDVSATMVGEVFMLPIRVIGEILDLEVGWDNENKNVILNQAEKNQVSLEEAYSILVGSEEGRFGKNIKMDFIHTPALDYDFISDDILKDNYVFRVDFISNRFDADYLYCINKNTGEIYLYLGNHSFALMSDIENSTGVVVNPKILPVELELGKIFTSLEILKEDGELLEAKDIESLKIVEVGNKENIIGEIKEKEEIEKYSLSRYGDMYSIYLWVDILKEIDPEKEYMWLATIKGEEIKDNLNKIRFTKDPRINDLYIKGEFKYIEDKEGLKENRFTYSLENPTLEIAAYNGVNLKDLNFLQVYLLDENKLKLAGFNRQSVFAYDEKTTLRSFMDIKLPIEDVEEGLHELVMEYKGKRIYEKEIYFTE